MSGLTIGSLFSGSGMLDEAVRAHFGGTVAWYAEHEPATEKNPRPTQAAARLLAYRFPDVPNLGDISAVDWSAVEPVDVLTGGSPCQDVSHAGKRAGMHAGTRSNLWVAMREAVAVLRPRLVTWENVRGAYSACADSEMGCCPRCVGDDPTGRHAPNLRALGRVLGDLSALGFDCRWHGLRAADVGAPHGRFRVFIVATNTPNIGHERSGPARTGRPGSEDGRLSAAYPYGTGSQGRESAAGRHLPHRRVAADSASDGQPRLHDGGSGEAAREGWQRDAAGSPRRHAPADADRTSRETRGGRPGAGDAGRLQPVERGSADRVQWGPYEAAIRRWERILARPAPAPTEPGPRGGQRLSPRFTEFMMGWPDGWVTDVPGITRNEALRICGNGVVPQQALAALERLSACEAVA